MATTGHGHELLQSLRDEIAADAGKAEPIITDSVAPLLAELPKLFLVLLGRLEAKDASLQQEAAKVPPAGTQASLDVGGQGGQVAVGSPAHEAGITDTLAPGSATPVPPAGTTAAPPTPQSSETPVQAAERQLREAQQQEAAGQPVAGAGAPTDAAPVVTSEPPAQP
jgi:hypothetical protein